MPSACVMVGSVSASSAVRPLQPNHSPPESASASRSATASPPAAVRLLAATRFDTTTRRDPPVAVMLLLRRTSATVRAGRFQAPDKPRNGHLRGLVPEHPR